MAHPINPQPDDFFYGDGDIEMAELRAAGAQCSRQLRQSERLKQAGDLSAAADACPHGWGYPLKSLAAANEHDPREGETGVRCKHCNSVVSGFPWESREPVTVLHPCEPRWC